MKTLSLRIPLNFIAIFFRPLHSLGKIQHFQTLIFNFLLPDDWSTVPKSMPSNKTKPKASKLSGVVNSAIEPNNLQGRDERIRSRVRVGRHADAQRLPLRKKHPFVVRGEPVGVVRRGVHDSPERPVDDLVEHRRGVGFPVDSSVEVRRPDRVLPAAGDGDDVAELAAASEREGSDGG